MFASKAYIKSYVYTGQYMVSGMIQTPIHGSVMNYLNSVDEEFLLLIGADIQKVDGNIQNAYKKLIGTLEATKNNKPTPPPGYMSPSTLCAMLSVIKQHIYWLTFNANTEKKLSVGSTERYVAVVFGDVCVIGILRMRAGSSLNQFLNRTQKSQQFQTMHNVTVYKTTLHQQQTLTFAKEDVLDTFSRVVLNLARAELIYEVSKEALICIDNLEVEAD